jgi:RNA polymerase II subunit A small phosphatase-like protein
MPQDVKGQVTQIEDRQMGHNAKQMRPLLILDLDETLLHASEGLLGRFPDFQMGYYSVYLRPHLEMFLPQVSEWYQLAVWTSASPDYAGPLVESIFPPNQLRFVWTRERCTRVYNSDRQERYWVKDLKKVRRQGYELERTLVLDDSPEKLERHYGNWVPIKPYYGEPDDNELPQLLPFLYFLSRQEKVRSLEKRNWHRFKALEE